MNCIKPCDVPASCFLCCCDYARNRISALAVLSHSADLEAVLYFSHQCIPISHNAFTCIRNFLTYAKVRK